MKIARGGHVFRMGTPTSSLPLLHLDMQQVVDDAAAVQDAHQLFSRRLHAIKERAYKRSALKRIALVAGFP